MIDVMPKGLRVAGTTGDIRLKKKELFRSDIGLPEGDCSSLGKGIGNSVTRSFSALFLT